MSQMAASIRPLEQGDEAGLIALARSAADAGRVSIQVVPRSGRTALAAGYPGAQGYVAIGPLEPRPVGVVFSSVAPTRVDHELVPGAYLFGLRVDPAWRRRGVGAALVEHAWQRAREAGAVLAWAGVLEGNVASLRLLAGRGFTPLAALALRVLLPLPWPAWRSGWEVRAARTEDLPLVAELLDASLARQQLSRPCSAASLVAELEATGHRLDDVLLALSPNGSVAAAGVVLDFARIAQVRLVGHKALPAAANRALAWVSARVSPRLLLLRQRALPGDSPHASLALLRGALRRAGTRLPVLVVPTDPRDPAWPAVARLPGYTARLQVLARGRLPRDRSRPVYLA